MALALAQMARRATPDHVAHQACQAFERSQAAVEHDHRGSDTTDRRHSETNPTRSAAPCAPPAVCKRRPTRQDEQLSANTPAAAASIYLHTVRSMGLTPSPIGRPAYHMRRNGQHPVRNAPCHRNAPRSPMQRRPETTE